MTCLRFLAKGDYLSATTDIHGISKASGCLIVHRVVNALCERLHNIQFPTGRHEWMNTKAGFIKIAKFPNVAGIIDDTQIPIQGISTDDENISSQKMKKEVLEDWEVFPRIPVIESRVILIQNAIIRNNAQQHSSQKQKSFLQPFNKQPPRSPSVFQKSFIRFRTGLFQCQLKKIADYMLLGENFWWSQDETTIIFDDSAQHPVHSDPRVYTFIVVIRIQLN